MTTTGRLAFELSKKGFKEAWRVATRKRRGPKICAQIENVIGRVDALYHDGWRHFVSTEDGELHAVSKGEYQAFRREISKEQGAACLFQGEKILNYSDGKLDSIVTIIKGRPCSINDAEIDTMLRSSCGK